MRQTRWSLLRWSLSKLSLLIMLLVTLLASMSQYARAATITVGGGCTLEAAIIAANNDDAGVACGGAATGLFVAGERDYILLEASQTYTYATAWGDPFGEGNTALPPITSTIVISGNNSTLVRDQTLSCPAALAQEDFRFFTVYNEGDNEADLRVYDLALLNGCANGGSDAARSGGAIRNVNGAIGLSNVDASDNMALGDGGVIASDGISTTTAAAFTFFANNNSQGDGGAIHSRAAGGNGQAEVALASSNVVNNTSQGNGGGVHVVGAGSAVTLTLAVGSSNVNGNVSLGSGGGLFVDNQSTNRSLTSVALGSSNVFSNRSQSDGGGIYAKGGGNRTELTVSLGSANVNENSSSLGAGGGLYVENTGTADSETVLALGSANVLTNGSQGDGGGFALISAGERVTMSVALGSANVNQNSSQGDGGGFYVANQGTDETASSIALGSTNVLANTSQGNGGGFYFASQDADRSVTSIAIGSVDILTNTSQGDGGGFYVIDAGNATTMTVAIGTTDIRYNDSQGIGGGAYINHEGVNSTETTIAIGNVNIFTNTSGGDGGGLFIGEMNGGNSNDSSSIALGGSSFIGNRSSLNGGALAVSSPFSGSLIMSGNRFLSNVAEQGGALYAVTEGGIAANNCIVGNYAGALTYTGAVTLTAFANWWGAADGPGGDFDGSGDQAFGNINVSGFETTPILDCPTLQTDLVASAQVDPAGATPLLPGQPVTFTAVIDNNGPFVAHSVAVTQSLEADYGLATTDVITVNEIGPNTNASVPNPIVVPLNLTANHLITYTQLISGAYDTTANGTAVITKLVTMPTVRLAATSASVDESDDLLLGVELDMANPYADSLFAIQTSDGSALAGQDYTAINQQFVIPAGEQSTLVAIPIADDVTIEGDENFVVTLSVGDGLFLGTPTTATITIVETLVDAALVMTKTLGIEGIEPGCTNMTQRTVPISTTVLYCYTITNTGSVPLSNHSLVDDKLGVIAVSNAFILQPDESMTATVTRTLTVSVTNVATWTAQVANLNQGLNVAELIDEMTVATTGVATLEISSNTLDQDGDTIPDNVEGAGDQEGDNQPNFLDDDADGDERLDRDEVGPDPNNPQDSNGDGTPDFLDPSDPTALDPDEQPQQSQQLLIPYISGD